MQKRIVVLIAVLVAVFGISMTAMAEALIMNLRGGDSVEVNCEGSKLTLSRQSNTKVKASCKAAASNPTPVPPTPKPATPVPPTPKPEPNPSGVALCPDHDPTQWHALFDAERNCHYNHEHHDDPHEVDDIFGLVGDLYGGQEISYPWQTFSSRGLENDVKHPGYKWLVRKNMGCFSKFEDGCLTDFRMQVHFIAAAMDATVRFHSFWLEARGCRENNPNVCGIIRTGGWTDFGHLEIDGQYVPLSGDPGSRDSGHRRIHYNQTGNSNYGTWYGQSNIALTAIQTSRMWSKLNPSDPAAENLFCPNFRCSNNGSNLQAHAIGFNIRSQLDNDGDGLVNFSGYTNRYGDIVNGCTEVGLDCVPLEIINMPVGRYQYRDDNSGMGNGRTYDTSPAGEWWITFPN
jgi:hypothetical protein